MGYSLLALPGDVGEDAAGFQIELGALQTFERPAVDVDLDGGQVGLVVYLVDFVHFWNEEGHFAGLGEGDAVLFQQGVFFVGAVVEAAEAGLGEDVFP